MQYFIIIRNQHAQLIGNSFFYICCFGWQLQLFEAKKIFSNVKNDREPP